MTEKPNYPKWDTPTGLVPVKVRHGENCWQTQVKIGDQWVACEVVYAYFAGNARYPTVTLRIPCDLTVERYDWEAENPPKDVADQMDLRRAGI